MRIENVDFPKPLIEALHDNELVVFAGAGVSMGKPARLPSFKSLTNIIAEGTGKTARDGETPERFLGRLKDQGVKVHVRAARPLSQEGLQATALHQDLLRLYPKTAPVRLVTTNFDPLFEQAAEAIFDSSPEVFRAPALPLGREFDGIVHVHGSVRRPNEMVLTDRDFGHAYLTDGWAQRFLVELFSNFRILFVGYSHDDTIMNYLARALPAGSEYQRFILTGSEDKKPSDDWRSLGIEPIVYPQANENDYSELDTSIHGLAELVQRRVVVWNDEITNIAQVPPPTDENKADLIEYALSDEVNTRFFTKAASDPDWIGWLDERGHLTALFRDDILTAQAKTLSWWLADRFLFNHANRLFLLIGKHNMRLHPQLWRDMGWKLARNGEVFSDKDTLRRWISLLLTSLREKISMNDLMHVDTDYLLPQMGELCIENEMLDDLLQIFDWMMDSRIRINKGYSWPSADDDREIPSVDAELIPISEQHELNELWEVGLKPKLPQVAKPLLDRVIRRLEGQYLTLCTWGKVHGTWDPISEGRSAIEPEEGDGNTEAIDVMINAARDCLVWLASNQVETATQWCNRHVRSGVTLLRRLAVHGVYKREDLTADDKIDWLQTHINQIGLSVGAEVFPLLQQAYPEACPAHRSSLIEAMWTYRWPKETDSDGDKHAARQQFDWFNCIHRCVPDCLLAKAALDKVLARYPEFKSMVPQPLIQGDISGPIAPQSTPPPKEILPTPTTDRRHELMSVKITAWDEAKHRQVFHSISKIESYAKFSREIADALYALVINDGPSYALKLLPQAQRIASALWPHLDRTAPIDARGDWLFAAMNHPAGLLAYFWISALSLWREHHDPKSTILNDDYRRALSDIVVDRSPAGTLGRTVLASKLHILLDADQVWTREYLLPLFDPCSDDFQSAWDGFVKWGKLNPSVAKAMTDLFLKAVTRIGTDLFNQRDSFVKHYIGMLIDSIYIAEDPLSEWIPKIFNHGSQDRPSADSEPTLFPRANRSIAEIFASVMSSRLRNMPETEQRELWEHWLKDYWQNRLEGVPSPLMSSEAKLMLDWLTDLTAVFPDAVALAVQMPSTSLGRTRILSSLVKNSTWLSHPDAVAKLLIYLWQCGIPAHYWHLVQKIVAPLVESNIPAELQQKLEDIRIQL